MSNTPATVITRHELQTALIEKCWKDPLFRQKIINDPRGVIEEQTGRRLPPEVKIFVHEEDANSLHFAIPPAPNNIAELSDEDLEKVAGGTDVIIVMGAITLFGSAAMSAAGVTALNREKVGW